MKEMSDLICGKAAVGGNNNSTRDRQADGVIVFSMRCICAFMENAYTKVGMVKSAGGRMFTVQEGELGMVLRNFAG